MTTRKTIKERNFFVVVVRLVLFFFVFLFHKSSSSRLQTRITTSQKLPCNNISSLNVVLSIRSNTLFYIIIISTSCRSRNKLLWWPLCFCNQIKFTFILFFGLFLHVYFIDVLNNEECWPEVERSHYTQKVNHSNQRTF